MKAVNEIREERTDVFSFWVDKKVLNSNDEIEVIEEKVDECTVVELENRIVNFNTQIEGLKSEIIAEQLKIELANAL